MLSAARLDGKLAGRRVHPTRPSGNARFCSIEPALLRAMIVDDDPGDIALIDRAIRRMVRYEVQVTSVTSLANARFALAVEPADIILIDYTLHAECGTELIRELSAAGASMPVILLTSLWTAEIEAEVLDAGGIACLSKDDLTPRIMETTIRQALRGRALETTLNDVLAKAARTYAGTAAEVSAQATPQTVIADVACETMDLHASVLEALKATHADAGRTAPAIALRMCKEPVLVTADYEARRKAEDWLRSILEGASNSPSIEIQITARDDMGEIKIVEAGPPMLAVKRRGARSGRAKKEKHPIAHAEAAIGTRGGRMLSHVSAARGRETSIILPLVAGSHASAVTVR